jgi:PAS domain S-box-containing protein
MRNGDATREGRDAATGPGERGTAGPPLGGSASGPPAEASFRALANAAPVMLWLADPAGRREFLNARWLDFTGRPAADAAGWAADVHPDDRTRCLRAFREALRSQRACEVEYRLRHADGEYRWVLDHGVPRFDAAGGFAGTIGSCVDIHDRVVQQRQLEQAAGAMSALTARLEATVRALRGRTRDAEEARAGAERTERQARFLAEASRVLHSSLDHEQTLRTVVELAVPGLADWCVVYLLGADGAVQRIETTYPDARRRALADELRRYYAWDVRLGPANVMRTGRSELYPVIDDATLADTVRGERALELLRAMELHSAMIVPMTAGGRTVGAIAFLTVGAGARRFGEDELRLAEELARRAALAVENARLYREVEEASRAKSEFLATMSHELRTPLNAISGYTDLLQLGISDPEQRRAHLERIKDSTWQLQSLIEEILSFSRLDAGAERIRPRDTDAVGLTRDVVATARPAADRKGLRLVLDLPAAPLTLHTDPLKLRQVLLNLIGNAVKFTPEGDVAVAVAAAADGVVWTITDTGIGIRREDLDLVFEPFWQADRGTTRRAGGTGLGLTVARQLAELLGGALAIASEPGRGTRVTLQLPHAPPVAATD